MARPQRCRRVCGEPRFAAFSPSGVQETGVVQLSTDEFEVLRLVDFEKKTHAECAQQMEISRTTVTEIYDRARFKVADFLVNGKKLAISGGNYRIGEASAPCGACRRDENAAAALEKITAAAKADGVVRIAVPTDNGCIFGHFGRSGQFTLYDTKDCILQQTEISMQGLQHSALTQALQKLQVDVLLCGGIGNGAKELLEQAGILCCSGIFGQSRDAVEAYLRGAVMPDGND